MQAGGSELTSGPSLGETYAPGIGARHDFGTGAAGGELWVRGRGGAPLTVTDDAGRPVFAGALDRFGDRLIELGVTRRLREAGGLVLRDLDPGRYRVRLGRRPSVAVELLPDDVLPPDWAVRVQRQRIDEGFGYVETRDGTRLSVNVLLPDRRRFGPGPHPTVVQYSAYDDSRPDRLTGDADLDDGLHTELNLLHHLGFAVVGVNARGTGASGGALRMFVPVHGLDGYDVVEALAAQPWCGRVGLFGASGPGFFALRTAATAPPSLAAVVPAAVLGTGFGSGRRPGGLVNSWVVNRLSGWSVEETEGAPDGAHPARYRPGGWDEWVPGLVEAGDDVAAANQVLRGQTVPPTADFVDHLDDAAEDRTAPGRWMADVRCPVLLVTSWQDQESGPGGLGPLAGVGPDVDVAVLGGNGTHEETRFPEAVSWWAGWLSERLRGEALTITPEAQAYVDAAVAPSLGLDHLPLEVAPRWTAGRPVVVRVDNGAGPAGLGQPTAACRIELDGLPPSDAVVWQGALGPDGSVGPGEARTGRVSFRYDPSVRPPNSGGAEGFDVNDPGAEYDWRPLPLGHGLAFLTAPWSTDRLLCGPGSVDLWVGCSAPDIDLEVTLTEVRPDGWETYVQSGWLRLGLRALDHNRSSPLVPRHTFRLEDEEPLPPGTLVPARIAVPEVVHRIRAGSRLALRIEPPGGVLPTWTFDALWPDGRRDGDPVVVSVGTGPEAPSRLALPLLDLDGRLPPDERPAPGALRRQPSRPWWPGAPALGRSGGEGADLLGEAADAGVDAVVGGDMIAEVGAEPAP